MAVDGDVLREDVQSALTECVQRQGDSLVTKYVAVVETINGDGDRAVWTIASSGIKAWEVLGMLEFGKSVEHAARVADALTEDDE